MPLHTHTPRRAGPARAAIIVAATGIITGGATIAIDGQTAAQAHQPAISRYHDIEANKASSMRALGLAAMQQPFASPDQDLEANKAIAIGALGLGANEQATRPSGYHDLEASKARIAQAR